MDRQRSNLLIMSEPVVSLIDDILGGLGFKRKGDFWYKYLDEVVQIVGLQKSSWGKQHYVNLGIWVNEIERKESPKISECHLQCRIDTISEDADDVCRALDEEDFWKMDLDSRRDALKLALCNAEFVFFRELNSLDAVKRYVKERRNPHCAVANSLRTIV